MIWWRVGALGPLWPAAVDFHVSCLVPVAGFTGFFPRFLRRASTLLLLTVMLGSLELGVAFSASKYLDVPQRPACSGVGLGRLVVLVALLFSRSLGVRTSGVPPT